jgi:hypothetical protein
MGAAKGWILCSGSEKKVSHLLGRVGTPRYRRLLSTQLFTLGIISTLCKHAPAPFNSPALRVLSGVSAVLLITPYHTHANYRFVQISALAMTLGLVCLKAYEYAHTKKS